MIDRVDVGSMMVLFCFLIGENKVCFSFPHLIMGPAFRIENRKNSSVSTLGIRTKNLFFAVKGL